MLVSDVAGHRRVCLQRPNHLLANHHLSKQGPQSVLLVQWNSGVTAMMFLPAVEVVVDEMVGGVVAILAAELLEVTALAPEPQ